MKTLNKQPSAIIFAALVNKRLIVQHIKSYHDEFSREIMQNSLTLSIPQ
jgi:hypothetical protein